ncbi:uncharacterized protein LOC135370205 [Ornithodoros turicata]|uniref:uncharacterized protein LOC135370205 n=1 Tax=Ornithodoros turicata TaxID=34597 RepID=UPI003138616B
MYTTSYMSGPSGPPGPQHCDQYTSSLYFTGSTATSTTTSCLGFPMTSTSSPWSMGSVPTSMAWSQTVPAYMPWAAPSLSEQNHEVMRFTAPPVLDPCTSQTATAWELLHNLGSTANMGQQMHKHLKRRCEIDDERPHKQYVTEEKMIAQMSDLRISMVDNNASQVRDIRYLMAETEEGGGTSGAQEDNQKAIVLSPELQNFVSKDRLATECIIDDMRKRASMALVLWQPPSKILSLNDDEQGTKEGKQTQETNNNDIEGDHSLRTTTSSLPYASVLEEDQAALFDSMDDSMDL